MTRLFSAAVSTLAVLAAVIATLPAVAQTPSFRQTREFVQAAAQSDEFEIMEATTALAQSQDPQVRTFAQEMIDAHRRTSAEMIRAVTATGLTPPSPGISGDQSMFLAALQSARGVEFDRLYARQQILAHRAALATVRGYATGGEDPKIRETAAATLPVITSHLRMAEQLQASKGGS